MVWIKQTSRETAETIDEIRKSFLAHMVNHSNPPFRRFPGRWHRQNVYRLVLMIAGQSGNARIDRHCHSAPSGLGDLAHSRGETCSHGSDGVFWSLSVWRRLAGPIHQRKAESSNPIQRVTWPPATQFLLVSILFSISEIPATSLATHNKCATKSTSNPI